SSARLRRAARWRRSGARCASRSAALAGASRAHRGFGGGEHLAPHPQVDAGRGLGHAREQPVEPPPAGASRVWNLARPEDVSERDVAEALAAVLGREVKVVEAPLSEVVPTFTGFGLSAH